jgi:hypothetical protein
MAHDNPSSLASGEELRQSRRLGEYGVTADDWVSGAVPLQKHPGARPGVPRRHP